MTEFQRKFDQAVIKIVSQITAGQVLSYGEVARMAGFPRHARMVSQAMSRSPKPLPWFRVVRSNRTLAFTPGSGAYRKQAQLLLADGVSIVDGKVIPLVTDQAKTLDELLWSEPYE